MNRKKPEGLSEVLAEYKPYIWIIILAVLVILVIVYFGAFIKLLCVALVIFVAYEAFSKRKLDRKLRGWYDAPNDDDSKK